MSAIDKILSSDAFEGRAPGTAGEAKTVAYLIAQLRKLKLQPAGENGGWTQRVPLIHTQVSGPVDVSIDGLPGGRWPLAQNEGIYVNTARPAANVAIQHAPMVFVGYGVSAPERSWDDFKGADLHGKIAVFLVNDPDFEALPTDAVAGRFGGKAMTWYGRWFYKYEEAARRGAIGALIVHEDAAAGYGWSTVIAPQGEVYDIVRGSNALPAVPLQGWLQKQTAIELFRRAGLDFEAEKRAARNVDFHPIALGNAAFSARFAVSRSQIESRNVLAKITGTTRPDETVIYGSHWDTFGIGTPDAEGRTIRPGANDDGLGVSGELEIARAFANGPKPHRTVVFAFWTAEERGLLGSETYAAHPLFPLSKTAANITIDVLQTAGPSRDVVLIGAGQNSLEENLARLAARQDRVITPDSHPERGLFYRADHFSLAKRGVPTLLLMGLGGGPDLLTGGRAAGEKWVSDYTTNCYHKTCDAWNPAWDLRGAAQDIGLLYALGRDIADSRAWPSWSGASEFRPIRDASASERK
jgi:Zn-dependent M28 family amino/carboxypeptidase